MNEQKQFEELARIEGWVDVSTIKFDLSRGVYRISEKAKKGWTDCPNYDSHDALQRVIENIMDEDEVFDYQTELDEIVKCGEPLTIGSHIHTVRVARATPAQKREAILRACGRWE